MNDVLAVFAKQPKPGMVKTRLAASTSPQWAAQVAEAFLLECLIKLKDFPARRVVVFDPQEAKRYFANLVGGAFEVEPQGEGNLGERMENFLTAQLSRGADKVVIIGTDSPTLPLDFMESAFAELQQTDVVIGPATDGGYYLIGCRRRVPDVFTRINWGQATVLQETVAQLRRANTRFTLLPSWYDVDTLDDWRVLCEELRDRHSDLIFIQELIRNQATDSAT